MYPHLKNNRPDPKPRPTVLYQGRLASVVRDRGGARLDLEVRSSPDAVPERFVAVHRGPGGWTEPVVEDGSTNGRATGGRY